MNCGGAVTKESTTIKIPTISDYSNTYTFAQYDLNDSLIMKDDDIGICGSVTYTQYKNDAYDMLYNDAKYSKDGTWEKEGFETKTTHAIKDTADAIRANMNSESEYSKQMESVDDRYNHLTLKSIPEYKKMKYEMERNSKYNFKVKSSLHDNSASQIQVRNIDDNNELYMTSQLMLTLGALVAFILIVFAIIIAYE